MALPEELTTSDWVDALKDKTRDEQIAILATYHRRIEYAAKQDALNNLPQDEAAATVADLAKAAIEALPAPKDYTPV